jgi:hypothetical protein
MNKKRIRRRKRRRTRMRSKGRRMKVRWNRTIKIRRNGEWKRR